MPLGDSITQGYRDSYRRPLWLKLQRAGIDVDFVGSMKQGLPTDYKTRDFDGDHEGHWGWRVDEILARIDDWVNESDPDVVLLHLGTNDLGMGQDIDETVQEVGQIVQRLRNHNGRIHILLAALIPMANEAVTRRIRTFNDRVAILADEMDAPKSRVILVDQFTGFDAHVDTYDGLHPNDNGNMKIANHWFAAIQSIQKSESTH